MALNITVTCDCCGDDEEIVSMQFIGAIVTPYEVG